MDETRTQLRSDHPSQRSIRVGSRFRDRRQPSSLGAQRFFREITPLADADPGTVRLFIDTKTTVPIGNLSRGGKSRRRTEVLDHDLEPEAKLTPFGIHRPDTSW